MKKYIVSISLFILFLQPINTMELSELTIIFRDDSTVTRQYHTSTEFFDFSTYRDAIKITGLERFPNLKELRFARMPFMTNFNFLIGMDTVETLVFLLITFDDINFLYEMASLRNLVLSGCSINSNRVIDESRLPNLEYFEFTQSRLVNLPIRVMERQNINTINIAGNNITNLSSLYDMGILIIANENPIRETGNPNILTGNWDDFFNMLPERYHRFLP